MSGLSEDVIRQITERVTREVVAALTQEPGAIVDEYPDYDEYGGVEQSPIPRHALTAVPDEPDDDPPTHSALRDRMHGIVDFAVKVDDGPTVDAMTLSAHRPDESWIAAQWAKEPASVRNARPPAHAIDAWEGVG